MKSPSTLKAYHEKAICALELLQKAKDRVQHYKNHLKLFNDRHRMYFVHNTYRNEGQIIDKIISSHRTYQRIKTYYLNLLKRI